MAIQLQENEQVQHRARKSYMTFFEGVVITLVFIGLYFPDNSELFWARLIFLIPLSYAIHTSIDCVRTRIVVTNKRLLLTDGIWFKREVALKPSDISSFYIQQSFLGRCFNYGTLSVNTEQGKFYSITRVHQPYELEQAIKDLSNESDQ